MFYSEKNRINRISFTLIELVVVIIVATTLAAVGLATFREVTHRATEQSALSEARALSKEAVAMAKLASRESIISSDFTSNDLDNSNVGIQYAEERNGVDQEDKNYWLYTSRHKINVRIYDDGTAALDTFEYISAQEPKISGSLRMYCVGLGVNSCTDDRAIYASWESSEQSSYKIEITPATSRYSSVSRTADNDREIYLGMGQLGSTYQVTLTIYKDNNFTDISKTEIISYTITP
jgi:hypothetical protein